MTAIAKKIRSEFGVCKIISLILLLAALILVLTQLDLMKYRASYFAGNKLTSMSEQDKAGYGDTIEEKEKTEDEETRFQLGLDSRDHLMVSDNNTLEIGFTARERTLVSAGIMFQNPEYFDTSGKITVSVKDKKGNRLGTAQMPSGLAMNNKVSEFIFIEEGKKADAREKTEEEGGLSLNKGNEYVLEVQCEGFREEDGFGVCITDTKENGFGIYDETENKRYEQGIYGVLTYYKYTYILIIFFMLLIFVALVFCLTPWRAVAEQVTIKGHPGTGQENTWIEVWLQRIMLAATPFICFWMSYKIAGKKTGEIIEKLFTVRGALNLIVVVLMMLLIYLVINRAKWVIVITSGLIWAFCAACYFLKLFRNSPLMAADLMSAGTAADVAANYEWVLDKSFLWITVVTAVFVAAAMSLKQYKGLKIRYRIALMIAFFVAVTGFYTYIDDTRVINKYHLRMNSFNPNKTYGRIGYILGFTLSWKYYFLFKPDGYTKSEVEKDMAGYRSDTGNDRAVASESTPNIIVIMNEAFSDLSILGRIDTNKSYMPFFNGLREDAVKGIMHTSTFGGGTSNTEFEFLTGNTFAFLPFMSPYTTLIKDDMPSIARTLKDQGYRGNIAFHPGKYDSYNRNNVYPWLGFDTFISREDMESPKKLRRFVSDEADYDRVIEEFEKFDRGKDGDAPFFMFNVTMQNHGGYSNAEGVVDAGIKIRDSELNRTQLSHYLNLIKYSDDALKDLVEHFRNVDEPTVILLFGDHQPRLENGFYDVMLKRMSKEEKESLKEERRYQVPFMLWANFDIEEEEDVQIGANMLGSYMLHKLDMRCTGYDKFLMDVRKQVPVVTMIGQFDAEGSFYDVSDDPKEDIENRQILRTYQYIQYNDMKGDRERNTDFFMLKKD